LRAQQLEYEFTEESIDAALRHLKQALDIDPAYALAMAFAAYCYGWRRTQGWTKDVAAETAEVLHLTSRALELGRFDANVLWMSAVAIWQFGVDERSSLDLAYRSLETNPNSASALTIAGRVEAALLANFSGGKDLLARAHRLSPRDPRAWFTVHGMSIACLGEGQFEEGASWARKALSQNPRFTGAIRMLAANLAHLGQVDAGREAIAENLRIEPGLTIGKLRGRRMSMHDGLWEKFAEGLRLAGLPE
jgi:tetratricopeptide (TPR) repeat protein